MDRCNLCFMDQRKLFHKMLIPRKLSYFLIKCRSQNSRGFISPRLIFADKTGNDNDHEKDQAEKPKEIVNAQNAREVLLGLVKDRKINDSDVSKALEIIEKGSHEELMNLQGKYYELYTGGNVGE